MPLAVWVIEPVKLWGTPGGQWPRRSRSTSRATATQTLLGCTPREDSRESRAQAQLSLPGVVAHRLGQRLASLAQLAAQPSREAVVPGRLGEQSPGVRIARLGDRASVNAVAAGMLGRNESEVAHQLSCAGKAADVADLADQADGADRIDAAQGAQRCDDALEAPALAWLRSARSSVAARAAQPTGRRVGIRSARYGRPRDRSTAPRSSVHGSWSMTSCRGSAAHDAAGTPSTVGAPSIACPTRPHGLATDCASPHAPRPVPRSA